MKSFLPAFIIVLFPMLCASQKLPTGVYIFNYCDLEYNKCISKCKVIIRNDSIAVYATKELARAITFTKEGDLIDRGIILQHKSGKWIIGQTLQDKNAKEIGAAGPPILDFRKKQYWTF